VIPTASRFTTDSKTYSGADFLEAIEEKIEEQERCYESRLTRKKLLGLMTYFETDITDLILLIVTVVVVGLFLIVMTAWP